MTTQRRRWPIVLAGVAVFVTVVVIALAVAGTLFVRNNVQVTEGASREGAHAAFDAAVRPFADARPLLVLGDDKRPALAPAAGTRRNPGSVSDLRILAWDADKGSLATVTVPLWLLAMKPGPIVFGDYVSDAWKTDSLQLDVKDLERYGPGVVLDLTAPDGQRVLITAQ
jgi:hypothetical protein